MNMIKTAIATAAMAFALSSGAAVAQTATGTAPVTKPAVTAPPTTAAPKAKIGVPKTEISAQCSKEADEKKLHGSERKKFREACKKTAEKAKAAAGGVTKPAVTTAPATTTPATVAPAKKN